MREGSAGWSRARPGGQAEGGGQAPKATLAFFDFSSGTLTLTEASPKKRASLYLVHGEAALEEHNPGGIDVLTATRDEFAARLKLENRTLKRALTDPRLFSGIGNAYSDEILHEAGLSPTQLTSNLTDPQAEQGVRERQSRAADVGRAPD